MRKIVVLALIAIVSFSCASKRYAKKAVEFEKAGMYQEAADFYFKSLKANKNNVDARIGLKKNGEMVLNTKLERFTQVWQERLAKDATYAFIDAENYVRKLNTLGVELIIDQKYRAWYKEAGESYLSDKYSEGINSLNNEDFNRANTIFSEIVKIDPNYRDSKDRLRIAIYEPKYRSASENLNMSRFRSAYYGFNDILNSTGDYKESRALLKEAQESATITILVTPFTKNSLWFKGIQSNFSTRVIRSIDNVNSPFIKVKDASYMDNKGAIFFSNGEIDSKKAVVEGIDALLSGTVKSVIALAGKPQVEEHAGYLKFIKKRKDDQGVMREYTEYKKVTYKTVYVKNSVSVTVEYKLVSTRTGEVLSTDVVYAIDSDEVNYAVFEGDSKNLVPGYWKSRSKSSPEDRVLDNYSDVSKLRNMLRGNRTVRSINTLKENALNEASQKIAFQVEKYNPEK